MKINEKNTCKIFRVFIVFTEQYLTHGKSEINVSYYY